MKQTHVVAVREITGCIYDKFKGFSVADRLSFVRNSSLCFSCLSPRHLSNAFKSVHTCRYCKRSQNTLLHFERPKHVENPKIDDCSIPSLNQNISAAAALLAGNERAHVFLATAVILFLDKFGNQRQCRVVLDSGSQINFISKRLANLLQLPDKKNLFTSKWNGCETGSSSVVH